MEIHDYETGRLLKDVTIVLEPEEAEELQAYLARMLVTDEINCAVLSVLQGDRIDAELTVRLRPATNG